MSAFDSLLVFGSTHQALSADKILREAKIPCDLIPTPRRISAGCGLALELHSVDHEKVLTLLGARGIVWEGLYSYQDLAVDTPPHER